MSICCPKSIKGLAIRATRLDACGIPESEASAQSRIQTAGFISLGLSPNIEAGEEITVKKADGTLCLVNKDKDQLKGFDLTLVLCGIPLPLLEMLLGLALLSAGADIVGGVLPSKAQQVLNAPIMVEIWSRNKDADACAGAAGTGTPYIHWLLPMTTNWQLGGSLDFASANLEITLTGFAEESAAFEESVTGEWTGAQILAIRDGGALAWKCTDTVPTTDDCAYVAAGSGS